MKKRLTILIEEEIIRKFKAIAAYRGITMAKLLKDKLFDNPVDQYEKNILNYKIKNI